MEDDALVPFRNVNDLPLVPEGARREFYDFNGHWFYEDVYRLSFTDQYVR